MTSFQDGSIIWSRDASPPFTMFENKSQNGWTSNPRFLKRVGLSTIGFIFSAAFIVLFIRMTPDASTNLSSVGEAATHYFYPATQFTTPSCSADLTVNPLTALDAKYAHLSDEKFTIAMQTYHRPKELEGTLKAILAEDIPSLHEIVIVWNNLDQETPPDYVSEHGVKVRYRMSTENSLNQKLIPDPKFETKAILLTDDDVYYKPDDLEWVFQAWRKFGQFRLVGALPRCSVQGQDGKWNYDFCSNKEGENQYSMVLTNLCFSHIAYLDYYSSDAPEAIKIREYVDSNFNCEDIALNYIASSLTGYGPLEANGFDRYKNMDPSEGISRKPGHLEARSQCLNDFVDIFGCQPLVNEDTHVVRGMTVL